jgi:hypothetical protein
MDQAAVQQIESDHYGESSDVNAERFIGHKLFVACRIRNINIFDQDEYKHGKDATSYSAKTDVLPEQQN